MASYLHLAVGEILNMMPHVMRNFLRRAAYRYHAEDIPDAVLMFFLTAIASGIYDMSWWFGVFQIIDILRRECKPFGTWLNELIERDLEEEFGPATDDDERDTDD
jgi:hypothetical protein